MEKNWTTVEILGHSRHDWLNKIQLIKGNLELNKTERVKAIIDEIIIDAQHEARLSNLKMSRFGELLMTANWGSRPFRLEFEVIEVLKGCAPLDGTMHHWTSQLFSVLDAALDMFGENVLSVSIFENMAGHIRFSFELQGMLKNESQLQEFLNKPVDDHTSVEIEEITDSDWVFSVELKCEK
ncbi:Spo0B C-terminal domain-containing protein [Bacillus sp. MUM 13]|uniref:Spo0B C-terminal domain-containing protein n=1 Tax=Bacillus sp. MUM 13 TaxID=1678001 RepID=UPI0008F5F4CF|nr:Spo0B C-terminal domain-containing protein [Bacillus sp. MUM 13]OIK14322.1 hypothetical protein BIV59_03465 [Bacillus sp. MUM 13]